MTDGAGVFDVPAGPALAARALVLLDAAAPARERLVTGADGEALHDFRVSLRRLRSLLRAHRDLLGLPGKTRRRLRDLADATGRARDLEVQLAWLRTAREGLSPRERSGQVWLRDRLEKGEQKARARLERGLERDFVRVETALRGLLLRRVAAPDPDGPSLGAACANLFARLCADLRQALGSIHSVDDQAEAHAARLSAKRLRYALETVADQVPDAAALVDQLRAVQDLLGEMHDADVLSSTIAEAAEKAGAEQGRRASKAVRRGALAAMGREGVRRQRRRDPTPGLLALAARVQAEKEARFAVLAGDWLGGGADTPLNGVDALVRQLIPAAPREVEIERKYLLRALPPAVHAEGVRSLEMDQGYLPGQRVRERLRQVRAGDTVRWYRTIKAGLGVARLEVEEETTREVFETMWPLTEGRRLRKRRHLVPDGPLVWEIDEFLDRDLVLAEAELPDPSMRPPIPEWLAPHLVREVTEDPAYLNSSLAR